ncbi:MAG: hypothetical protein ABIR55_13730 [Burkholderiaceae bacterium]
MKIIGAGETVSIGVNPRCSWLGPLLTLWRNNPPQRHLAALDGKTGTTPSAGAQLGGLHEASGPGISGVIQTVGITTSGDQAMAVR